MNDEVEKPDEEVPGRDWRKPAEMVMQMSKEAERVARRTGAETCVVICIFKDGDQLRFQDAGKFPMPPDHFYHVMQQAHINGQMTNEKKPSILKAH